MKSEEVQKSLEKYGKVQKSRSHVTFSGFPDFPKPLQTFLTRQEVSACESSK
jgi:hypothetical protein